MDRGDPGQPTRASRVQKRTLHPGIRDPGVRCREFLPPPKPLANYYEDCLRHYPKPKIVSNWIMSELLRELKKDEREIEECPVPALHLSEMLKMIEREPSAAKSPKASLKKCTAAGNEPEEIVQARRLGSGFGFFGNRKNYRTGPGGEPQRSGGLPQGKREAIRFFCRPGDESHPRKGQPANGQ